MATASKAPFDPLDRPEARSLIVGRPSVDPLAEAQKIIARVGSMDGVKVFANRVLVAKYIADKRGSLISANQSKKEDRWQGKACLVLKVGRLAFVDDANNDFGDDKVQPGDWVLIRYSDGDEADYQPPGSFDNVPMKIVRDVDIIGVIASPELFI